MPRYLLLFCRTLARHWAVKVAILLSVGSTFATYLPSFVPGFSVPKWLPLVFFLAAVPLASYSVFVSQQAKISALSEENERLRTAARGSTAHVECEVFGEPPEKQFIRVRADGEIAVIRLDYMLGDGTLIRKEETSSCGSLIDFPINDQLVLEVQRIKYDPKDGSAPIRFRLHYLMSGIEKQFELQARIQPIFIGSTNYRRIIG